MLTRYICLLALLLLQIAAASVRPSNFARVRSTNPIRKDNSDGWVLAMSEEFNGPSSEYPLNRSLFFPQLGFSNGTGEVAYFTDRPANLFQSNGSLKLRALHEPYSYPGGTAQYTAAGIMSVNGYLYGRIEASIKMPRGTGTWPAFWMIGLNCAAGVGWPLCGEIDIIENVGFSPYVDHSTLHDEATNWMRGNDITNSTNITIMYDEFVVYGLEWTPNSLTIYGNGVEILHYDNPQQCSDYNWPYGKPMQLILNYAVGGSWGGQHGINNSMFPNQVEVDYIRVFEPSEPWYVEPCWTGNFLLALAPPKGLGSLNHNASTRSAFFSNPALLTALAKALQADFPLSTGLFSGVVADVRPYPDRQSSLLVFNLTLARQNASNATLVNLIDGLISRNTDLREWMPKTAMILEEATWELFKVRGVWNATSFLPVQPFTPPAELIPWKWGRTIPVTVYNTEYDFGGQEVGYFDSTAWNMYDASYQRSGLDYVDIGPFPGTAGKGDHRSSDFIVGWFTGQEWLTYSGIINPASTSDVSEFVLNFNYSNGDYMGRSGAIRVEVDGLDLGLEWILPSTGSFQTFAVTDSRQSFPLTPGPHSFRLFFVAPYYGLSSFTLDYSPDREVGWY
jgi:hypothetical protein